MRRLFLLALLCVSPVACDFFDDDSPEPGSYIPVEEVESSYKDAYCTYAARCGLFPDKGACVSANILIDPKVDANVIAAIQAGKIAYDGRNVKKCFEALAALTCDRTDQDSRIEPAACSKLVHGIGKNDDPCVMSEECASGYCSISSPTDTCVMGHCIGDVAPEPEAPAAIGEQCFSSVGCVAGAYCDTQALPSVCTAFKTQGTACNSATECAYGLSCVGSTTRTCMPLPGLNQACDSFDLPCREEGLYCDESTAAPTCKKIGLPPATCTSSTQCSTFYPCDTATGKCTKAPSVGQSCASSYTCFDVGTYCDTQTTLMCLAVKSDGSTCSYDNECVSGNCDTTVTPSICMTPPTCY